MANSSNDYCDVATATGKNFSTKQHGLLRYICEKRKLIGSEQFSMYLFESVKGKVRAFSKCTFVQRVRDFKC